MLFYLNRFKNYFQAQQDFWFKICSAQTILEAYKAIAIKGVFSSEDFYAFQLQKLNCNWFNETCFILICANVA